MAASACATGDLTIESENTLRWYRPTEEPAVGYAFCTSCGGSLFWRSDARPESISICAGTLDPPTGIVTDLALFGAEAKARYDEYFDESGDSDAHASADQQPSPAAAV